MTAYTYMIHSDQDGSSTLLERLPLTAGVAGQYTESWLQRILFNHPAALPKRRCAIRRQWQVWLFSFQCRLKRSSLQRALDIRGDLARGLMHTWLKFSVQVRIVYLGLTRKRERRSHTLGTRTPS